MPHSTCATPQHLPAPGPSWGRVHCWCGCLQRLPQRQAVLLHASLQFVLALIGDGSVQAAYIPCCICSLAAFQCSVSAQHPAAACRTARTTPHPQSTLNPWCLLQCLSALAPCTWLYAG